MPGSRLSDPIFLMCSERSGSNLVTKMFDSHPQVAAPGTSHLFRIFSELAWKYADALPDLRRDLIDMFDAKIGSWTIDELSREERRALVEDCASAASMIAALINAERKRAGKACFFVKENSIYDFIPFMESVSERPRYIFMVRDPRDMALSWHKAAVMRGGVVRAARGWKRDQEGFLRVGSWLKGIRPIANLTYEELLSRPETTLRRVCADLDLPYAPTMLEFSSLSRSAQLDAKRASAWENLSQPILATNSNKFSAELTDDQLAYVESVCGPLMERFGYRRARPDASPPFGRQDSLQALEKMLLDDEPWDKPQYMKLPEDERARFEHWSELYGRLRCRLC